MARYNLEGLGTLVGSQSHHFERLELFLSISNIYNQVPLHHWRQFFIVPKVELRGKNCYFEILSNASLGTIYFSKLHFYIEINIFFPFQKDDVFYQQGLRQTELNQNITAHFHVFIYSAARMIFKRPPNFWLLWQIPSNTKLLLEGRKILVN